ncbi:PDZ domain-containing protein [Candidatus Uhrbacteria bacterium]|nr:PDZ domain-containing protein [Candidatus Uhrbacteria bacterium]
MRKTDVFILTKEILRQFALLTPRLGLSTIMLMKYKQIKDYCAKYWLILAVFAIGISFSGGFFLGRGGEAEAQGQTPVDKSVRGIGSLPGSDIIAEHLDFNQFWELWELLQLRYYQETDDQEMFYGAMEGLAKSLGDPYTDFFKPKTAKEFSDSLKGEFQGIGAEIGIRDNQLQIIAPLPDTPASRAGLRAGDYILQVNGTSTDSMTVEQAVMLIRGKKGTTVTLHIGRFNKVETTDEITGENKIIEEPETFDVPIVRDVIHIESVRTEWPEERIAKIQITNFNEDTALEFKKQVQDIIAQNPVGLILDLRNNPGGFLDRSISIAGEWTGGDIVVVEQRKGKIIDEFRGIGSGRLSAVPTVVLVNEGSASASEIVAGALQDYDLATIIGMQTFGKGSVQDYTEFTDGSAVKITVAEWLTPKGRSINETGIAPDIEVELTIEDYNENRDPQLDKAIEFIQNPDKVLQEAENQTTSTQE